jgi:methionyl-tRNA formyltransferase
MVMGHKARIIFLGTTNELSRSTFATLVENGTNVGAVVVTAAAASSPGNEPLEELPPATTKTELPIVNRYYKPSLIQEAWTADIPVFALGNGGFPALRDLIASVQPEVVCVACFPRRLPTAVLTMPPLGVLNVHPSLLPHYRGPAPLFWLFQKDDPKHRGVTVHQMDEDLDTGPIVKQEPIVFANGQGQAMIENQCGRLGGRLLSESIAALSRGAPTQPQSVIGSYHPWPGANDFRLDRHWTAQRAFNFMRATNGFSMGYRVSLPGEDLILAEALHVVPEAQIGGLASYNDTSVQIQFNPGVLTASISAF